MRLIMLMRKKEKCRFCRENAWLSVIISMNVSCMILGLVVLSINEEGQFLKEGNTFTRDWIENCVVKI